MRHNGEKQTDPENEKLNGEPMLQGLRVSGLG